VEEEAEEGGSLEYQLEIDFWDAVRGAIKKLQITRLDSCETCHGTGAVGTPQVCATCNGSGTIQQAAGKMRFNVPCTRCGGTGKIASQRVLTHNVRSSFFTGPLRSPERSCSLPASSSQTFVRSMPTG